MCFFRFFQIRIFITFFTEISDSEFSDFFRIGIFRFFQIQIFQIFSDSDFQIFSDSENLNLHHFLYLNIQMQIFQILSESEKSEKNLKNMNLTNNLKTDGRSDPSCGTAKEKGEKR